MALFAFQDKVFFNSYFLQDPDFKVREREMKKTMQKVLSDGIAETEKKRQQEAYDKKMAELEQKEILAMIDDYDSTQSQRRQQSARQLAQENLALVWIFILQLITMLITRQAQKRRDEEAARKKSEEAAKIADIMNQFYGDVLSETRDLAFTGDASKKFDFRLDS